MGKSGIMLVAGAMLYLKGALVFNAAKSGVPTLAASSPVGALAVAIAGIIFLIDDLMKYLDGGDSVLGS